MSAEWSFVDEVCPSVEVTCTADVTPYTKPHSMGVKGLMLNKNHLAVLLASASLLAGCATAPQTADIAPPMAPVAEAPSAPAEPAPVSALVQEVAIPHSAFQLDNGLTVIVHEDHKAPVVAVSTWYNLGSKDEPADKTGFAHLFEH